MKKLLHISFLMTVIAFFATAFTYAQERGSDENRASPNASVSQTIGTTVVSITYGRPGLKGRTYFGEDSDLAPVGTVWRTGANESTAITFSDDVTFAGKAVEAGTYSLYTIPGEEEWTIILNNTLSWGTQYDEADDEVRVKITPQEVEESEWFEISFDELSANKAHMNLHWGDTKVAVPISTE